ncbi:MAG: Hpt domain-containing protein [Gammaproteobacteria bacterium]
MFDPSKLELLIGPTPDAQRHVLEKLVEELRAALPAMQQACQENQWQVVQNYAHKYRGTSAVVGASSCAEVLGLLEHAIIVSETQSGPQLLASLTEAIANFEHAFIVHLQTVGALNERPDNH